MIFSASAPRFQSTHPRGVRPVLYPCVLCQIPISIHAPARGATLCSTLCLLGICISIHAPARGATRVEDTLIPDTRISIHAPARGATSSARVTVGCGEFQSTHPRGVRLPSVRRSALPAHFNPRTREGCDRALRLCNRARPRFQSTHPRGVRQAAYTMRHGNRYFNPRTREGCDNIPARILFELPNFNPRTREGCDRLIYRERGRFLPISIHAPARGATGACAFSTTGFFAISIHAPARGATKSLFFISSTASDFNPRTREGCD